MTCQGGIVKLTKHLRLKGEVNWGKHELAYRLTHPEDRKQDGLDKNQVFQVRNDSKDQRQPLFLARKWSEITEQWWLREGQKMTRDGVWSANSRYNASQNDGPKDNVAT